jgi:hypothetical protein
MPVAFSPADAKRIADTVRRVEKMPHNKPANRRRHVTGRGSGGQVMLGKTAEAILKNTTGTVIGWRGGETEEETETEVECKNLFADMEADRWVIYAKIDGAYYLIAGDCGG